jgi:hypothetical protein
MINVDIEVIHARPLFERLAEMVQAGCVNDVVIAVTVRATVEQMPAISRHLSDLADQGHITYEAKGA